MSATSQIQLRHLFKVFSGSTPESGKGFYWDGDIYWVTPEDVSSLTEGYKLYDTKRKITEEGYENSGVKMVPENSIVLTKRAPIGLLAILGIEACSNQGCFLLVPKEEVVPEFYYYYLLANKEYLQILGRGSTFMELSQDDLKPLKIPYLPKENQYRVVEFLDKETKRIDDLIKEKEKQLNLLSEKRQALVTQAVTKGVNPKAKLKDSGIDWLGEIPERWQYLALKRVVITKITDGPHETPTFVKEGIPFISAEAVKGDSIDFESCRGYIDKDLDRIYSKKCKPQRNDLLLVKSGSTTGKVAMVNTDIDFNIWSPLALIRANTEKVLPKYLFYSLLSSQFKKQVELFWSFGTQPNIGMNVIENLKVAVPSIKEQRQIIELLDNAIEKDNVLSSGIYRSIELLKDRRFSLITAAVNGQI